MMAEILETISNARVKVEYDDPYSGSPFFSENSLSAKIEKSPTLILNQEGNQSPKKDTLESGNASMASSVQELQETNSVTSDTRSEELTAIDNSHSSGQVIPEEFEEVCYENVSSNLPTSKNKELSPSRESAGEGEILSDSFCELDSAIYDAPWDLGALQKGLEEKFKLNEQSSQDDLHAFDTSQKPPPLSVSAPRTSLPTVLAFHGKNSPELVEKFPKHGSNTRQSAKGRSPSRKTDPNSTFDPCDPRQVLQKRPLPAFPTPQSTPTSSFKSNNFPSSSLVSVNDRQHFQHPLQRRGVPVMGGGSVGRGHQLKPSATQASDWRPLEDYDSPWDNRQKDLMSTFSQASVEPSSLMGSMKNIAQHQFSSLAERIESRLPLEQEWWYHGPITRQDAEKRLKSEREGSYLIRNSESNRLDYSLSIKSSNGCIHLKIVPNSEGRFILGQFSQPFASVAQMIQHYTVNKLPIKGAEHMSLTFPVGH